jgi:protein-S-isoprenylcysteine O-methyltransferase Ste14
VRREQLDYFLYTVHSAFWMAFVLTLFILRRRDKDAGRASGAARAAQPEKTAPFSRALVAFHGCAFGLMYFGMGAAIIPGQVPFWFRGQRVAGTLAIAAGAALVVWALVHFRSWRFRAKLDSVHQLATEGPFRFLRHPIYMGLNLLALGSALWVPTAALWVAFLLMTIGGDLRARAEEKLLEQVFGSRYREYQAQTPRFVPGVY